jgi:hypothetical protein
MTNFSPASSWYNSFTRFAWRTVVRRSRFDGARWGWYWIGQPAPAIEQAGLLQVFNEERELTQRCRRSVPGPSAHRYGPRRCRHELARQRLAHPAVVQPLGELKSDHDLRPCRHAADDSSRSATSTAGFRGAGFAKSAGRVLLPGIELGRVEPCSRHQALRVASSIPAVMMTASSQAIAVQRPRRRRHPRRSPRPLPAPLQCPYADADSG